MDPSPPNLFVDLKIRIQGAAAANVDFNRERENNKCSPTHEEEEKHGLRTARGGREDELRSEASRRVQTEHKHTLVRDELLSCEVEVLWRRNEDEASLGRYFQRIPVAPDVAKALVLIPLCPPPAGLGIWSEFPPTFLKGFLSRFAQGLLKVFSPGRTEATRVVFGVLKAAGSRRRCHRAIVVSAHPPTSATAPVGGGRDRGETRGGEIGAGFRAWFGE